MSRLETFKVLCDHLLHVIAILLLQVLLCVLTLVITSAMELLHCPLPCSSNDSRMVIESPERLQPVVICLLDDLRNEPLLLANTLRDEAHDLRTSNSVTDVDTEFMVDGQKFTTIWMPVRWSRVASGPFQLK